MTMYTRVYFFPGHSVHRPRFCSRETQDSCLILFQSVWILANTTGRNVNRRVQQGIICVVLFRVCGLSLFAVCVSWWSLGRSSISVTTSLPLLFHSSSNRISRPVPWSSVILCANSYFLCVYYYPGHKASLPIGWYQIILLGDRGTCVLTTCQGLHWIAGRLEFKPATYWSQVRHPTAMPMSHKPEQTMWKIVILILLYDCGKKTVFLIAVTKWAALSFVLWYCWVFSSLLCVCHLQGGYCFTRHFFCLVVCGQLHVKSTDQIFMKILQEIRFWTRKLPWNFGSHPCLDPYCYDVYTGQ